jgi:hypothetical protein
MSSLNSKPGYNEANSQYQALKQQVDTLLDQRDTAAREFGIGSQQAQQYQQQASALAPQVIAANNRLQEIILAPGPDLASPTVTTGQSQSTPAPNARDDGPTQAPTSGGVGAGTSNNSFDSVRSDNNPGSSRSTTQQAINTTFASQPIVPQPNVLDQYASYTYGISWWLLSPAQFNSLSTAGPAPGTGNWSLLMQSGGAPIAGRNQAFPYDYYLDDLEIETVLAGKGTGMSTNGMSLKFKVVEPNGLTLIQNLFSAVSSVYGKLTTSTNQATASTANANQSSGQTSNYMAAQFCLTIEFYGYDSQGNLINPARGQLSTSTTQAVIKKYYPFIIQNLTFRTVANQIEYHITGQPVPYDTATSQARGTIPFSFKLSGQTVGQVLQGGPATATTAQAAPGERQTKPAPAIVKSSPNPTASVNDTTVNAGVNAEGNFTGETENPFAVVAP